MLAFVSRVRQVAGAAALAIVIGCAHPIVSSTPYKTLPPKASAEEVQVFTDARPDRPYEELGAIEVKALRLPGNSDYGKLVLAARQRAAEMGADAIVVTRRPQESTTTVGSVRRDKRGNGGGYVESTDTSEQPRISVAAIVWTKGR